MCAYVVCRWEGEWDRHRGRGDDPDSFDLIFVIKIGGTGMDYWISLRLIKFVTYITIIL